MTGIVHDALKSQVIDVRLEWSCCFWAILENGVAGQWYCHFVHASNSALMALNARGLVSAWV